MSYPPAKRPQSSRPPRRSADSDWLDGASDLSKVTPRRKPAAKPAPKSSTPKNAAPAQPAQPAPKKKRKLGDYDGEPEAAMPKPARSERSEVRAERPVERQPVSEEPVEVPVIEKPVVEEPVIEEPVIEEPVIEEPAIEEPVIEEPAIEEPVPEQTDAPEAMELEEASEPVCRDEPVELADDEPTTDVLEESVDASDEDELSDAPAEGVGPSADAFDGVPDALRTALEKRGFTALTGVQQAVLAVDPANHDLQISSQTGSGKTVAIGLALAHELLASDVIDGPTALVIAPTRELATQVKDELGWLFAHAEHRIEVDSVTGGSNLDNERRRLRRRPRVIVGTPGRLLDHLEKSVIDPSNVRQVVLDEADQMLELGFRDELDAILDTLPTERRTHLVSATFPDGVVRLTKRYQQEPLTVEGTRLGAANVDIQHIGHRLLPADRYGALVNLLLLAGDQRVLVFVRTRADAGNLAEKLSKDGFRAMPISGELQQAQRTRTLNAFRAGTITTLVATDVAARGLDIPDVSMVVHGDLPHDAAAFTHRSGRTGRAGRKGRSVVLAPGGSSRRINRIAHEVGIKLDWQDPPSQDEVRTKVEARNQKALHELVDAMTAEHLAAKGKKGARPLDRTFARELLQGRDPIDVVAALATRAVPARTCEPHHIQPMAPRFSERNQGYDRRPDPRGADRNVDYSRGPNGHPADAVEPGYVRFAMPWGFRDGANPRRVLAHVCRRGGLTGRLVGAIDVQPDGTTFDVQEAAAARFAARVRDARGESDPPIQQLGGGGAPPRGDVGRRPAPSRGPAKRAGSRRPTHPRLRKGRDEDSRANQGGF